MTHSTAWNVGDKVAISDGARITGPHKIVAVTPRKLKVSDGSEWVNHPYPKLWGSGRAQWSRHSLEEWEQHHEEAIDRSKRARAVGNIASEIERRRRSLTWDQINAIRLALAATENPKESE